jgi:uncharacterized protein involved in type VI secretion and phage assembly
MSTRLFDSAAREKKEKLFTSIVSGTVTNNCDLLGQGKVLVRIPSLDQEVVARLSAPGAGNGSGLLHVPKIGDEVLIALNGNDPSDAFVLGGLWSTLNGIPTDPLTATTKRVFKTGVVGGAPAHKVEFDDLEQSITITTSTEQRVTITPLKIEVSNTAGDLTVTLDNTDQSLTLKGPLIKISAGVQLELSAPIVSINGDATTTIKGKMVLIN